jgi:hypothetical protein
MRRERLIGEAIVSFASIDLELETNLWLPLEPRNSNSIVSLLEYCDKTKEYIINNNFTMTVERLIKRFA